MSLDYREGDCFYTNIVPKKLFGEVTKLTKEQLVEIMDISDDLEGEHFSKKRMDALYEHWKDNS